MKNIKDLTNERFGRWIVIGSYITLQNSKNKTERKWLCRCDCGTERYVLERSLISGGSKSCGCATRENSTKAISYDLEGQKFGDLTVIGRSEGRSDSAHRGVWWKCKCSCGTECDVLASALVAGRKTHCGCKSNPQYYFENIEGKTFSKLTALYPLSARDRKGGVIWHCKCSCGNEVDVPYNWLMYSNVRSCGCQKKAHDKILQSFLTRVDGTTIDIIKSKKTRSDNTSGVKGVYFQKGMWQAKIVFQQKQYYLGKYKNIADAIEARKEAEIALFDNVASHYERWKAKADSDPKWAENNPIRISVSKVNNELSVVIQPFLD